MYTDSNQQDNERRIPRPVAMLQVTDGDMMAWFVDYNGSSSL